MAEIKSTIDLVMERTKHLIMSNEEKEHQEAKELIEKIPGYVQKFLDGSAKEETVIKAYREIPEKYKKEARRKLVEASIERVELETPISLIKLLQNLLNESDPLFNHIVELGEILSQYREKISKFKEEITRKISARLGEKEISGNAIVVIPEETPAFANLTGDYEKKLKVSKRHIMDRIQ